MKNCLIALLLVLIGRSASAIDFVNIPDASQLKWQLASDGNVYLRNLNFFDPTFLACCYNYALDIKTANGKAIWSTILLKIATAKPISIGVNDKTIPSAVTYSGDH